MAITMKGDVEMKNIVKSIIVVILLGVYLKLVSSTGDYEYSLLEYIGNCIDTASFSIIGVISVIFMLVGLKMKNKFLVEDFSIVISIVYDILFFLMFKSQFLNNSPNSFYVLFIPIIYGFFISILMASLVKGKDYAK